MTESVIADFVGDFTIGSADESEPTTGRILMSPHQLVLATETERVLIPLSRIFDVRVGHGPPMINEAFDDHVTVAYQRRDRRDYAIIGAEAVKIDRFSTVLFKALLNGTRAHIATASGSRHRVSLHVRRGAVVFGGPDGSTQIELSSVVGFKKVDRPDEADEDPVLDVRHIHGDRVVTTVISRLPSRKMNILGRLLRLEYNQSMEALSNLELTADEVAVLEHLRATDGEAPDGVPGDHSSIVDALDDKGLVRRTDGSISLTAKGTLLVDNRSETVG